MQVKCVVFDKTGTLTTGKPVVVDTKVFETMALKNFYRILSAAEVRQSSSTQPLPIKICFNCVDYRLETVL